MHQNIAKTCSHITTITVFLVVIFFASGGKIFAFLLSYPWDVFFLSIFILIGYLLTNRFWNTAQKTFAISNILLSWLYYFFALAVFSDGSIWTHSETLLDALIMGSVIAAVYIIAVPIQLILIFIAVTHNTLIKTFWHLSKNNSG